jgi:hypothetical protein
MAAWISAGVGYVDGSGSGRGACTGRADGFGDGARLPPCGVGAFGDLEPSLGLRLSLRRFCLRLASDIAPPSLNAALSVSEPAPGARLLRFLFELAVSSWDVLESLRIPPIGAEDEGGTLAGEMGREG